MTGHGTRAPGHWTHSEHGLWLVHDVDDILSVQLGEIERLVQALFDLIVVDEEQEGIRLLILKQITIVVAVDSQQQHPHNSVTTPGRIVYLQHSVANQVQLLHRHVCR